MPAEEGPRRAATGRARWLFAPHPWSHRGRDEGSRLRAGLEAALRAGHGAGIGFTVRVVGGAEGTTSLTVENGAGERWAERALLTVYDPGEWRRVPSLGPTALLATWSGRRRGLPGERGGAPPDPGRVLRALSAALRFSGRETSLSIAFRPAPSSPFRFLDAWWPSAPPAPRVERPFRAGGTRATPAAGEAVRSPPGPVWAAAVDVSVDGPVGLGSAEPTLEAVRSAWTVLDGIPLVLREARRRGGEQYRVLLSEAELVGFLPAWDVPHEPGATLAGPGGGLPVGRTRSGSVACLPVEAAQGRHFAFLGETGMGKSSLLVTVAVRATRLGGLVVLDPLGETAEAIRHELAGLGREVLWVEPGAPCVGANALSAISSTLRTDPVRAERALEDLVHGLRRVRAGRYADSSYWGPRLEEMVVRAVRAAAFVPGGTFADAHALLSSAGLGRSVVPPGAQAEVRELAERIRDRPDDAEGARRLLYEIVRNPTLVGMLCSREPALSFQDLVAPGRIVLVSGAASRVGESTARYLVAAYLALVWSELLARSSGEKTFVLLDEAQWFAHEGLGEMLRLARRRNVHVGLATQSLASLPPDVRDAVRTNVADFVVFRGSPEEAVEVGRIAPGLSAEAVLGLARGEAAALLGKGEAVRWVRTARLPDRLPAESGPPPGQLREIALRDREPTGGVRETHLPRPPSGSGPSGEEEFLADLRAQAAAVAPGALLRVDLRELREIRNVEERQLRALGGELGRRGAIVRTDRGGNGVVWWVEPRALSGPLGDRAGEGTPPHADVRKHL